LRRTVASSLGAAALAAALGCVPALDPNPRPADPPKVLPSRSISAVAWAPAKDVHLLGDKVFAVSREGRLRVSSARRTLFGTEGPVRSPNGRTLAVVGRRGVGVRARGSSAVRWLAPLRFGLGGIKDAVAWSPDGRRLAFSECLRPIPSGLFCEAGAAAVVTVRVDGAGGKQRVARGTCADWHPSRLLAFRGSGGSIVVARPDGSNSWVAARGAVACSDWSPDGESLAVETKRGLAVVHLRGGAPARLEVPLVRLPVDLHYPAPPRPAWSPDGSEVAVVRATGDPVRGISYRVVVVDVSTGRARELVRTPYR
jgi:WD40-like Beta Propeller Repeat